MSMFKRQEEFLGLRPGLRKIVSNTAWLFSDRVVRMPINLFVGSWLARYLGPSQFGALNYAMAFVALIAPMAAMGIDSIVIRDLVRDPDAESRTLGTGFAMKLIGNIALIFVIVTSAWVLHAGDKTTRWIIFIFALSNVFSATDLIDLYYQSMVQAKYAIYARNIAFAVGTILRVIWLLLHGSILAFAWISFIESVATACALIAIYQAGGHQVVRWRAQWSRAKQLLAEGWPLMLSGLVVMIYMRIDLLMLGSLLGDEAVGKYAAAEPRVGIVVLRAIGDMQFGGAKYHPDARSESDLLHTTRTAIVHPDGWDELRRSHYGYGSGTLDHVDSLRCQIPVRHVDTYDPCLGTPVCLWAGRERQPWLVAEGLLIFSMVSTVVGAVVNVLLNLWLIPRFGGPGAAVATLIAQFVAVTGMTVFTSDAQDSSIAASSRWCSTLVSSNDSAANSPVPISVSPETLFSNQSLSFRLKPARNGIVELPEHEALGRRSPSETAGGLLD